MSRDFIKMTMPNLREIRREIEQEAKKAMNKSISEAQREGRSILKDQYRLPLTSAGSELDRPALNVQVKAEKVKTIGGFRQGVKATLWAITHPISLIRMLPKGMQMRLSQIGIKRHKRKKYVARLGQRTSLGSAFVEEAKGRKHVFRRRPGTRNQAGKETLQKQALPSAHAILDRPENQRRLEEVAIKSFEKEFMRKFK